MSCASGILHVFLMALLQGLPVVSSSRFPSSPSQLQSVRLPSSDRSLWAPNRHVGLCSGRLNSAGTLHLCYNRVDPSQLKPGRCLSIRSRRFDLNLLPDGWSRLVANSLIWRHFQSTAFSLMLLGSSGPANCRYFPVGTTSALIKLCAHDSPWDVSLSRLRSCQDILRWSGTDNRSCFPSCCPTQISHA